MTTRDPKLPGSPCWADLWTSDVEGSRRFYSELFGWEPSNRTRVTEAISRSPAEARGPRAAWGTWAT